MKKYLFLTAAALVLSLALAGCSGSKDNTADDTPSESVTTETATDGGVSKYDENFTDADKDVDMDAIEGDKAKTADDSNAKGSVNGAEVKIGDAKVVDYGEGKAIIVSFEFKNNTSSDTTFNGLLSTDANQEDAYLTAALTLQTEGYVPETIVQTVGHGDKITVQRAFNLYDDTTPVTITVDNVTNPNSDERITKTFNIK